MEKEIGNVKIVEEGTRVYMEDGRLYLQLHLDLPEQELFVPKIKLPFFNSDKDRDPNMQIGIGLDRPKYFETFDRGSLIAEPPINKTIRSDGVYFNLEVCSGVFCPKENDSEKYEFKNVLYLVHDKSKTKLTVREISKLLGYPVEVIEEKTCSNCRYDNKKPCCYYHKCCINGEYPYWKEREESKKIDEYYGGGWDD